VASIGRRNLAGYARPYIRGNILPRVLGNSRVFRRQLLRGGVRRRSSPRRKSRSIESGSIKSGNIKSGSIKVSGFGSQRVELRAVGRSFGDRQPQRFRFVNDLGRHFHIGLGSRYRSDSQQLFVTGNQVSLFVQVSDDQLGGLVDRGPHRNRAQLPEQVVAQVPRLREEVFERRLFDLFHLSRAAITGIKIVLEERAEIDLLEGVLFLIRDRRRIIRGGFGRQPVALFLLAADIVKQGNGIFELFQNRVLDHLGVDHVPELELVEREHRHHLHQTRRQNLPLR